RPSLRRPSLRRPSLRRPSLRNPPSLRRRPTVPRPASHRRPTSRRRRSLHPTGRRGPRRVASTRSRSTAPCWPTNRRLPPGRPPSPDPDPTPRCASTTPCWRDSAMGAHRLLAIAAVVLAAPAAYADQASTLKQQGLKAAQDKNWEVARERFEQSY